MLQIENTIISFDVLEKRFHCDLSACRGHCCLSGDAGAPLEEEEINRMEDNLPAIKKFMRSEGIEVVNKFGVFTIDDDLDQVTPLINNQDCAFTVIENGIVKCAIENAWKAGVIDFQKPISCHLYPIRIKKHRDFEAVNFHTWEICKPALELGNTKGEFVYTFVKDALIRKYGDDWYAQLDYAAKNLKIEK